MAYKERSDEELIAAFERWLERHPSPDEQLLMVRDKVYSAREFVKLIKSGQDPFLNLEKLRAVAREQDLDPLELIDNSDNENQCDGCDQCDQCHKNFKS